MTTAGSRCGQPGCGGVIDDGYCDVCGMAAAQVVPATGQPGAASAGTISGGGSAGGGPEGSGWSGGSAGGGPGGSGWSGGSAGGGPGGSGWSSGSAGGGPEGSGWSSGSAGAGSRRGRRSGGRAGRGSLGAGLIEVPAIPVRDPASAVLADPAVPENKRFCGVCDRPVGRGRDGRPGLADGYCAHCGTRFSFTPKLARGELVAGQYEVLGCLAHGGLGWIYLATDRNLSDRWVVLKGLLNSGDAAAQEAAIAERRFLAQVEHPAIVGVYNFVQHADQRTGEQAGYIVMEYVGGQSLRQVLLERRRAGQSLPLPVALAYMIEILPALGYLHSRGLVYCDFKPDNVIQSDEQLKLIDMGGVRRIDDSEGAIYGTVGYQAPEIADVGPSPSSDLYTVGRALAVLSFEFTGYQTSYQHSLPDPASVPLLAEQESFLRALRRATDADPGRRFGSAGEMAEQLTGVLREVLATADQQPRPAFSALFSPELQAIGVPPLRTETGVGLDPPAPAEIVAGLPVPQVDPADPAAGYLASLSTIDPAALTGVLAGAVAGAQGTPQAVAESEETLLALTRARIVTGDLASAWKTLAELAAQDTGDWRVTWYRGMAELAAWNPQGARASFDAVYDALPGELAPKLALAFAAEAAGDRAAAARYFRLIWTVDRSPVSAAFGLARTRLADGDRAGAVAALASVPAASTYHLAAQVAAVRIRVSPPAGQACVGSDDLRDAGRDLARIMLDPASAEQVTAEVLRAALDRVLAGQPIDHGELLGCETTERALRFGLERSYRAQAEVAPDRRHRIALVDSANDVRPRTWS